MANAVISYNAGIPWLEQQMSLRKYEYDPERKEIIATYLRDYDDVIICKVFQALAVPFPSKYTPVHHIPIRTYVPEPEPRVLSNVEDTAKKRRIGEERDYDDDDVFLSEPKGRKKQGMKNNDKVQRDARPSRKKAKIFPKAAAPAYLEQEYVVEKVVDVRYRKKREFLIKWSGWSEEQNTWEVEDALEGTTFIQDFFEELCDDNVGDLATQLARIYPNLPVIDNAILAEENRKTAEFNKKVAIEIQQNKKK